MSNCIDDLLQRRDLLSRIGRTKSAPRIQFLEFGERSLPDWASAIRRGIQDKVVDDHELPIPRELHIQFDPVCAKLCAYEAIRYVDREEECAVKTMEVARKLRVLMAGSTP